jgi:hypothetical protein
MARPLTGAERARPDLAETFEEYDIAANIANMIGPKVLPVRNVRLAHGTYPRVTVKELMRRPNQAASLPIGHALRRAPRGTYPRDDFAFTESPYRTVEHGNEGVVDDNEKWHYDSYFDHEAMTTLWTRQRLMIESELRISAACMDLTTFVPGTQSDDAGSANLSNTGADWTNHVTSDPIEDVFAAITRMWDIYGIYPDSMVMNKLAFRHLRMSAVVRDRIAAGAGVSNPGGLTAQANVSLQQLRDVFDIPNIHVGEAALDAANPNAAFLPGHIWPNHCLIYKTASASSMRSIGLGNVLHWSADGSMPNGMVEDYNEPQNRGHIIRVRHQVQELIKYPLGFLITNVI